MTAVALCQLWSMEGVLYRVAAVDNDDLSCPIVVEEAARAPSVTGPTKLCGYDRVRFENLRRANGLKLETCSVAEWIARVSA